MNEKIKCVVRGSPTTGRTTFLTVIKNNEITEYINREPFVKEVEFQNKMVQIEFWDQIRGLEECVCRLRTLSYPGTNVFMILFSVVSPESFKQVKKKWYPELIKEGHAEKNGIPIVLIGTHVDLREDPNIYREIKEEGGKVVTKEDGEEMVKKLKMVKGYYEVSSTKKIGIEEAIKGAIECVLCPKEEMKEKEKCLIQ